MQQQWRHQIATAPQVQAVTAGTEHQQRQEVVRAQVQGCKVQRAQRHTCWQR